MSGTESGFSGGGGALNSARGGSAAWLGYSYGVDYWALVAIAACGLCGNTALSASLVCVRRLRLARGANCFALHHLALHAALAAYCVPFAAGVSRESPLPHCELLGSALLFALALVPFNLLALALYESYRANPVAGASTSPLRQPCGSLGNGFARPNGCVASDRTVPARLSDAARTITIATDGIASSATVPSGALVSSKKLSDSRPAAACCSDGQCCCGLFGLLLLWFASLVLSFGVILLPAQPTFSRATAHCALAHDSPGAYVLHLIWTAIVAVALLLTLCQTRRLRAPPPRERSAPRGASAATCVTNGFSSDVAAAATVVTVSASGSSYAARAHAISRSALRRRRALLVLVAFYVLFWCPLFSLNLLDIGPLHSTRYPYRALTIFGLSSSVFAPFAVLHFLGLDAARIAAVCCPRGSRSGRNCSGSRRATLNHSQNSNSSEYRVANGVAAAEEESAAEHIEMKANPLFAIASPTPASASLYAASSLGASLGGHYRPRALTTSQVSSRFQNRTASTFFGASAASAAGSRPECALPETAPQRRQRPLSAPQQQQLQQRLRQNASLDVGDEIIQVDATGSFVSFADPSASYHCLSSCTPAAAATGPHVRLPSSQDLCPNPNPNRPQVIDAEASSRRSDVDEELILPKRVSRLHTSSPRQSERVGRQTHQHHSSSVAAAAEAAAAARSSNSRARAHRRVRLRQRQSSIDRSAQCRAPLPLFTAPLCSRYVAADAENDRAAFGSTWRPEPAFRTQQHSEQRADRLPEDRAHIWANTQATTHCSHAAAASRRQSAAPDEATSTPLKQPSSLFFV